MLWFLYINSHWSNKFSSFLWYTIKWWNEFMTRILLIFYIILFYSVLFCISNSELENYCNQSIVIPAIKNIKKRIVKCQPFYVCVSILLPLFNLLLFDSLLCSFEMSVNRRRWDGFMVIFDRAKLGVIW